MALPSYTSRPRMSEGDRIGLERIIAVSYCDPEGRGSIPRITAHIKWVVIGIVAMSAGSYDAAVQLGRLKRRAQGKHSPARRSDIHGQRGTDASIGQYL